MATGFKNHPIHIGFSPFPGTHEGHLNARDFRLAVDVPTHSGSIGVTALSKFRKTDSLQSPAFLPSKSPDINPVAQTFSPCGHIIRHPVVARIVEAYERPHA
ncbi:MAG: hypothetical protein Q8Q59_01585 [Luteolibacter sp.]|jgi:hypothetical protein|nr:hypothetical protein [Luteolibacter sp.]